MIRRQSMQKEMQVRSDPHAAQSVGDVAARGKDSFFVPEKYRPYDTCLAMKS
jgi:hypothetical protein